MLPVEKVHIAKVCDLQY